MSTNLIKELNRINLTTINRINISKIKDLLTKRIRALDLQEPFSDGVLREKWEAHYSALEYVIECSDTIIKILCSEDGIYCTSRYITQIAEISGFPEGEVKEILLQLDKLERDNNLKSLLEELKDECIEIQIQYGGLKRI